MGLTCGALFAGIGGFCHGFEDVGIKTLWANDIDEEVEQTYKLNFPDVEFLSDSISDPNFLLKELPEVDILHGGFPCQSFSQAGLRKGFNDPRGQVFIHMINKIADMGSRKPKVLLFENSPYLRSGDKGRWFSEVSGRIRRAGYRFSDANALEIDSRVSAGSPQSRVRLFMLAVRRDLFPFNPFTACTEKSEKQHLENLLERNTVDDEFYFLNDESKYSRMIMQAASDPCDLRILQLRKYVVRVQKHGECPTLTANMGEGGHNVPFILAKNRVRKLTERECLRLQGFPESFVFPKNIARSSRYRMIGNAVHVNVARMLAKLIRSQVLGESQRVANMDV